MRWWLPMRRAFAAVMVFDWNATMADLKSASPALFTAIQDLGLTLEPRTTSAKYLPPRIGMPMRHRYGGR